MKALLIIIFRDIHVHDHTTGQRLIPYESLHIMCNQLQLVLENKLSDPEDKSLAFDFKLTGRPAPNHTHVVYKEAPNEFLNRPLEDVMPNLATVQYATILMQYITANNISQGIKRLQQPVIGCHDFSRWQQSAAARQHGKSCAPMGRGAAAPQEFSPAVLLGNSQQRSCTTRVPAAAQKIASDVPGLSHQELGGAAAAQGKL
ncbi:TPA: hypothetical protein ACH3X1_004981 [Trebouxia sp. C0004]